MGAERNDDSVGVKAGVSKASDWTVRGFVAATFAFVAAAIVAVVVVSPRVPFADAWRHTARLLTAPFPASVLAADNGHPEVFANLVRYASLHWLHGEEWLQIGIGLALALASLGVLLHIVWRTRDLAPAAKAAVAFVLTLGVFWLGNGRALLHDNESLHVYSVLLCVTAALSLLSGSSKEPTASAMRVAAAAALCFVASFNFGSGIAGFGALLALLFVQRAPASRFYIVGAGLLLAALCYRLLEGSQGALVLQPWEQASVALRWLAAPLIYLFWPFVDPVATASLPHPFENLGVFARAWTALFGDVHVSVIPQAIGGAALVIMLVLATVRARKQRESTNDIERLGLSLAWFALGIAVLVALTRARYFAALPSQLYAPRYLPWSSLAWAGILVAMVAKRPASRVRLLVVAAVGALALVSGYGMTRLMSRERNDASDAALAAVVGVWPQAGGHSENDPGDMRNGAHALARAAAGPFAWPEAALIGQQVPHDAVAHPVEWLDIQQATTDMNTDGVRLEGAVTGASCERLLVVVQDKVIGLLRQVGHDRWRGAARGVPLREPMLVFEACRH